MPGAFFIGNSEVGTWVIWLFGSLPIESEEVAQNFISPERVLPSVDCEHCAIQFLVHIFEPGWARIVKTSEGSVLQFHRINPWRVKPVVPPANEFAGGIRNGLNPRVL